jgi:DNA polymerase III, gamma/tau subunits
MFLKPDDIIGHEKVRQYFYEAIKNNVLSHAHLIVGEDGIGKSLIAKECAVNLLGKNEIKEYIDIIEFRSLKNKKSIGVDDIRRIIEEVSKKPFEGDKKVIIIYDGANLTIQAQNAFLKTIEEPPKGVFIFILCENSEMILDTIKSRCQIHKLNKLNKNEINKFIISKYGNLSINDQETMLAFSDGVPGKVERFVEDDNFKEIRNISVRLLMQINSMKSSEIFAFEELLSKQKDNWEEFMDIVLSFIRDIMIYKDISKEELLVNKDKIYEIKEASERFSFNKLNGIINIINYTKDNLKSNVNAALSYDVMLLKMIDA